MVSLKSFKSIDLVDEKQHYATPLTPTIQNTKILSTSDQQQQVDSSRLARYNQNSNNSNYQAPQGVEQHQLELTDHQQDRNILPKTSKHKQTTQHLQDTSYCQDLDLNESIKVNGKRVNCKRATSTSKVLFGSKKMSTVVEDAPVVASVSTPTTTTTTSSSSSTTSHIQNKDTQQTTTQITDDNQASDARQLNHKKSIHQQAIITNNHNANIAEVQSTTKDPTSSSISIIVVNHETTKTGTPIETAPNSEGFPQLDTQTNEREEIRDSRSNKQEIEIEILSTDNKRGNEGDSNDEFDTLYQTGYNSSEHFEIVWSDLSYKIEPKWYKKISVIDKIFSFLMPGQTPDNHSSATSTASSSAGMNDNQHQMHSSANAEQHLQQQLNLQQTFPKDHIQIFNNLNGTIKSGQMTAILGPSGAGKTTLLNCLTGKLRTGVSGHINLLGANGKRLKMCTIPQKDHLLELLTVEENLWFASKIKNPQYGFDHVKNIERVIDLLGLKRCRTAKINKISGGQHKRVSIAQELLSNPDILVLDEPTSGLDSLTCYKTISMLRDLVELSASNDFMKPMAIIVTIHQPQPKVFNLFHHVYILANGGKVIYEGPPQTSMQTIASVTNLSLDGSDVQKSGRQGGNTTIVDPASFLIEVASEEYGLEPILLLSDYQCKMSQQRNQLKFSPYETTKKQRHNNLANIQLQQQNSKQSKSQQENDNLGFEPNFGSKALGLNEIETFVPTNSNVPINNKRNKRQTNKQTNKQTNLNSNKLDAASYTSNDSTSCPSTTASNKSNSSNNLYMSEQLRYTQENNHSGKFWAHMTALTHRTLLTTRRDPLLMTSRILFHLMIPILMSHVYGNATGAANACPNYESEIDITQIPSLVEGKRIEYMLEELHMSIENISMFFIIMYAFAAAVLALNALSFPLNMQVLLKETRNGWYSMSSYVAAKTLADLPLELTMPTITMALVYPLTGQPSSYLQWRMLTICLIMTLCSLIAQTQALILGALVMNSVQTAVFVSQASQLPWVILAGFTIRIKRLSEPLQLISLTSFYRLGCEAITLTRYGFGICPCNPQDITGEPVKLVGIPDQLRNLAQVWIESANKSDSSNSTDLAISDPSFETTTLAPGAQKNDIFQHLANQLSFANSYGVNITSCDDVAPDRIRAINLNDSWLIARIWHLFIMLVIMKFLLYYAVRFSIGIRL